MRDFKGIKRQRGRNRGGSAGGGSSGGGGKPQHNTNRAFDSNGPDGIKVRGAAQSVYEKYQQLARDAQTAGDRVLAENYLQHAEHYFRLLRAMQPLRPLSEIIGRDQFVSGYDIDFEEEIGSGDGAEGESQEGVNGHDAVDRTTRPDSRQPEVRAADFRAPDARHSDNRQSDARQPDSRMSEARSGDHRQNEARDDGRGGEASSRDDRARDDRYRDDRNRDARPGSDRYRGERPSQDRFVATERDARMRQDRDEPGRTGPVDRDPLAVVEPRATPLPRAEGGQRGSVLRADDGDISHAPAFLSVRPPEPRPDEADSDTESSSRDSRSTRRRRSPSPVRAEAAPAEDV